VAVRWKIKMLESPATTCQLDLEAGQVALTTVDDEELHLHLCMGPPGSAAEPGILEKIAIELSEFCGISNDERRDLVKYIVTQQNLKSIGDRLEARNIVFKLTNPEEGLDIGTYQSWVMFKHDVLLNVSFSDEIPIANENPVADKSPTIEPPTAAESLVTDEFPTPEPHIEAENLVIDEIPTIVPPITNELSDPGQAPTIDHPITDESSASDVPLNADLPIGNESPAPDEPAVAEDLTVVDKIPALDEPAATEDLIVVDEIPALDEPAATEDLTVVDETPALDESAATEDLTVVDEILAPDEPAATEDLTVVDETPGRDKLPITEDSIILDENPATKELSSANEVPSTNGFSTSNLPIPDANSIQDKIPNEDEVPSGTQSPDADTEVAAELLPKQGIKVPAIVVSETLTGSDSNSPKGISPSKNAKTDSPQSISLDGDAPGQIRKPTVGFEAPEVHPEDETKDSQSYPIRRVSSSSIEQSSSSGSEPDMKLDIAGTDRVGIQHTGDEDVFKLGYTTPQQIVQTWSTDKLDGLGPGKTSEIHIESGTTYVTSSIAPEAFSKDYLSAGDDVEDPESKNQMGSETPKPALLDRGRPQYYQQHRESSPSAHVFPPEDREEVRSRPKSSDDSFVGMMSARMRALTPPNIIFSGEDTKVTKFFGELYVRNQT
jgi:hypothetical protein